MSVTLKNPKKFNSGKDIDAIYVYENQELKINEISEYLYDCFYENDNKGNKLIFDSLYNPLTIKINTFFKKKIESAIISIIEEYKNLKKSNSRGYNNIKNLIKTCESYDVEHINHFSTLLTAIFMVISPRDLKCRKIISLGSESKSKDFLKIRNCLIIWTYNVFKDFYDDDSFTDLCKPVLDQILYDLEKIHP